jgi:hypothetical protein
VSTANAATTTATNANSKADQAIAAVASSINYTLVANVAAIPASPANNTYIEISDSTGLQSFTPLVGRPGGFVGDSGLTVRLVYQTSNTSWNWLTYFANNSETRYLKLAGGTLTGALTLSGAPSSGLQATTKTYVDTADATLTTAAAAAQTTANAAVVRGGDTMTGALAHPLGAAATPSITFTGDTNTGIYSPGADQVAISTAGSGRLFIDASGKILVGTSSWTTDNGLVLAKSATALSAVMFIGRYDSTVTTGNGVGQINFGGTVDETIGATLTAAADADWTHGTSHPTRFVFLTTPSGSSSPTERLRITSAGLVGIGTSSPDVGLHYRGDTPKLRIESSNTLEATAGTEEIGRLEWEGFKSSNFNVAASIRARQDGTWSTSTQWIAPSALEFYTQDNTGVEVTAPRMLIDSSGKVGIGTTSPDNPLTVAFESSSTWTPGAILSGTTNTDVVGLTIKNNNASASAECSLLFIAGLSNNAQHSITSVKTANNLGDLVFRRRSGASASAESLRIDSSGRLLVGTSSIVLGSPQTIVEKSTSDLDILRVQCGASETASNLAGIAFGHGPSGARPKVAIASVATGSFGKGSLAFFIDQAGDNNSVSSTDEVARIDSSGRLLVGTSTAGGTELIQVQGTSGGSNLPGGIALRRSSLANGDDIGYVNFTNASGNIHASIKAFTDGTPGASDYPGALTFSTTADNSASLTERFRISSTGAQSSVIPGGSTLYPSFGCRAWVNFNGTGTVAIRASGNVSSITDNGEGSYRVNFTTAMPDANYVVTGVTNTTSGSVGILSSAPETVDFDKLTTSLYVFTYDSSAESVVDRSSVNVAIFR